MLANSLYTPCSTLRGIVDKYKEPEQMEQLLNNGYLGRFVFESGKEYYHPQIPIYIESVGIQNYSAQSKAMGADNSTVFKEFA